MNKLADISNNYTDTSECNTSIWLKFRELTNSIPYLKAHRDYIEKARINDGLILGHGDRPFQYFWKLLVDEMPNDFSFLEIGVYKGQILSLIELLSSKTGKTSSITGVTPLYDPDFANYNRMPWIEKIYNEFQLSMNNTTILDGLSQDKQIIEKVSQKAPFDIVYVDGDHSYNGAKNDIEVYGKMVKKGGYLIVDDAANFLNWPSYSPNPEWAKPDNMITGIEEVSKATRDSVEKSNDFVHLFACGHIRIFKRVDKKKIAFVKFGGLSAGGTERFIQTIAANLPKDQFQVDYYYCDSAPYIGSNWIHPDTDDSRLAYVRDSGVNLIKFNVGAKDVTVPTHDWVDTDFWSVFDESKYDLIQTARAGHPEYPFTMINDTPIIDIITLPGMAERKENVKKVIHISMFQANTWLAAGGDVDKLEIVPLISEIKDIDSGCFKDQFGLDSDTFVFGFHQRNDENIFSSIPLEAYSMLENDNIAFVLMGGSEKHREQAKEFKNVFFIDHSGDEEIVLKFLKTLNVFTHGRSDGETYSLAIAEAMYYGLPIVSHSAPAMGHVETIGDGGVVVNSVKEYVDEMDKLITNDSYYNIRSSNAKKRYSDTLSLDANINKIIKIYKEQT